MKSAVVLVALGLAGVLALGADAPNERAPMTGIDQVAWLRGCWEMASANRTVEERWSKPRGNVMTNVGRTFRGDSLIEFEFVVVRAQGTHLAYEAHPSNQPTAVFLSRSVDDSSVVFENKTHDFPQRVGYQKIGTDSLLAWIEGTSGGRKRRIEFPYRRVGCE